MQNLSLFEEPIPQTSRLLKEKLGKMAQQGIYVGTSSWKYEGWLRQIYTPERYWVHGRFSRKRFEKECLAEYAETFSVVCGDFSFYQFPTAEFWLRLFQSVPSTLRFAFKIPEEITVRARSGAVNPNFLDANLLKAEFLDLLVPYRDRIALLIFEFGTFPKTAFASVDGFLNALAPAVAQLPREFRYAVEIRNPEFLGADYFAFLHDANIAHVFNSWTRMPPLEGQMLLEGAFTAGFTVARALLRPGRKYEDAVNLFSPYREVQEPSQEVRNALRNLLIRSKQRAEETYIFVNNRLEGNAPQTIEAVVADW